MHIPQQYMYIRILFKEEKEVFMKCVLLSFSIYSYLFCRNYVGGIIARLVSLVNGK